MKGMIAGFTLLTAATLVTADDRIDQQALTDFVNAQHELHDRVIKLCNGKNTNTLEPLQQAIVNWFRVQALQLPAADFIQTDYVYVFWPDSKDRLKKQVLAVLDQSPEDVDWASLPASVKSLSAIEFLLQQEQPTEHCDWLRDIIEHQQIQAEQLQSLQAFYDFDTTERLTALHGTALTLHMVLKEVLSRPEQTLWVLAPGWRSDSGVAVTEALVKQSQQLLTGFSNELDAVYNWQQKPKTFAPLSYQATAEQLQLWNQYGEALASFVESSLAPALDVFIGFNNFDGD